MKNNITIDEIKEQIKKLKAEILEREEKINELLEILDKDFSNDED